MTKNKYLSLGYSEEDAEINSFEFKKTIMVYYPEYWMKKGYSEEDAITKAKSRKGVDYRKIKYNTPNYWIEKGYSKEDALIKIKETGKENSIRCKEYWIKRGYSEENAKIQVSKVQQKNSNNSEMSKYYWLNKEYSEDEARKKSREISKTRSTRCEEYWLLQGHSKEEASKQVHDVQKKNSYKSRKHPFYWIKEGYTVEEAKTMAKNFARLVSPRCEEYWINKGLNPMAAKIHVKKVQQKNAMYRDFSKSVSKAELEIYNTIKLVYTDAISQYTIRYKDTFFVADIFIPELNLIIEYFGDYWHMNPSIYTEKSMCREKTFEQVNENNNLKIEYYKKLGYKTLVIWENDYINKKINVIKAIHENTK